tara:strand:- start:4369 stop:4932 length:564 start_codon:yes stop_codon:yes gene_type:complete
MLLTVLAVALSACTAKGARTQPRSYVPTIPQISVADATARVANQTSVTYDFGWSHGTQIEYNAADGTNYLWYPGNKVILKAKWKIESVDGSTKICYLYGDNTYNPATKETGGKWECALFHNQTVMQVDRKEGDVFGLSKTAAAPHILARDAVKNYVPNKLPLTIPYLTDGKSPIEHLQDDFAKLPKP